MNNNHHKFLSRQCDKSSLIIGILVLAFTLAVKEIVHTTWTDLSILWVPMIFGLMLVGGALLGATKAYKRATNRYEVIVKSGRCYHGRITGVREQNGKQKVNTRCLGNKVAYENMIQMNCLEYEYQDENGKLIHDLTPGLVCEESEFVGKEITVYKLGWETYAVQK